MLDKFLSDTDSALAPVDTKAAIANFSDPGPVAPFVPAGKPPATPVPN
jgi:hypothetical protein